MMKISRLFYVLCLILSGFSFSVYADDMSSGISRSVEQNSNDKGRQDQYQPPEVSDEDGSLKIAPPEDKKGHTYRPNQSSENENKQNDNAQHADATEANKFDSV